MVPTSFDIAGTLFPLVFIAAIAFMVFAAVRGYRAAQRRREAIAAMVAANGWLHVAEDPSRAELFTSPPFRTGDHRRARDIIWGTIADRPFETFAYSYETHTTDSKGHRSTTTHHFHVTWVPLPGPVPTMRFTSDNALLRAATLLGARDLKVESHEFNQRWKVWCEDESAGHGVLTPRMIERFLEPDLRGRSVVIEGRCLMSYTEGQSDLTEIPATVATLYSIAGLIPAFVFEPREPA
jgi:hypothetical protein